MEALNKMIFGISVTLLLETTFLLTRVEASHPPSQVYPVVLAYWWEIPSQPPEKLLTPRGEDDEWYKRRNKKKYKNIR